MRFAHSPCHVLLALLPHLDIQQHQRVHADPQILLQAVIPAPRRPCLGIERQAERLPKAVQLQSGRPERGQNRRIVNDLGGYFECSSSEEKIRMRSRAELSVRG
jgi:hypothetical protein